MSWDTYTEDMTVDKKVDDCGIYSFQGDRWTEKCSQKGCSPDEVRCVAQAIDKDDDQIKMKGVCAFGKEWSYIAPFDESTVMFKEKTKGTKDQKKCSMVAAKSNQAVIIACCHGDKRAADLLQTATRTRDHLKSYSL